ncbi:hypothetical protein M9Y10_013808 [Tritrichomonas musculus]|uniref:Uncharacterized protein n=1 Tax=Tritrichomonas musculus TaxID=1915356 RepID=A0ABR2KZS7_9EUKA
MATRIEKLNEFINDFYRSVDDINEIETVEDILNNLPFEEDEDYEDAVEMLDYLYGIDDINKRLTAAYNDDEAMDVKIATIDVILATLF